MEDKKSFDWSAVDVASVPELLRQGELCLAGLLTSAIAADQRATALCGILGAAGVALLAGAATIIAGSAPDLALVFTALATATPLLVASILAGLAGRPTNFYMTGYEPHLLAQGASDHTWTLRYSIVDVQKRIDANRDKLARGSRLISCAFAIAALSLLTGAGTFVLLKYSNLLHPSGTARSVEVPVAETEKAAVPDFRTFCIPFDSTREQLAYQKPCH